MQSRGDIYKTHISIHFLIHQNYYLQIIYRLSTGYLQIVYRLSTDCLQVIYRLSTDYLQIIYRLSTDYLQVIYRLSTDIQSYLEDHKSDSSLKFQSQFIF